MSGQNVNFNINDDLFWVTLKCTDHTLLSSVFNAKLFHGVTSKTLSTVVRGKPTLFIAASTNTGR